jgi:hypothetical protein
MIKRWERIEPVLKNEKDYREQLDRYQLSISCPRTIEPGVVYWDWEQDEPHAAPLKRPRRKQPKFVVFPGSLSPGAYHKALCAILDLKKREWQSNSRKSSGNPRLGKKMTLGWMPQLEGHSKGNNHYDVRTAPTIAQPQLLAAFYPLLREMDKLVFDNLNEYYNFAQNIALSLQIPDGKEDKLRRARSEYHRGLLRAMDPWRWTYTLRGTIFSTVELNRNIIFRAHEDENNIWGTCVCIATLGSFVGGRLTFPRYGYSAVLGERDIIFCDNNHELHGNIGPIVGERFSIVALQQQRLLKVIAPPEPSLAEGEGDASEDEIDDSKEPAFAVYDPDPGE